MRRGFISILSTLTWVFCVIAPLRAQSPPQTVRVATIGHVGTPRSMSIAAEGEWRLIDLGDHHLIGEGMGASEWTFRPGPGGRVRVQGTGGIRALDRPVRPPEAEAAGLRLEGAAPDQRFTVRVAGRTWVYPGAVEVWPAGRRAAGLRLINEAPIEQYLLGVVAAEGSAGFHPEALKALAVAARSYAEHNRGRHAPEAEMCDNIHCQVYPGVGGVREKVARAVAETAGIVALYNGAVIDAVFSADCGGQTRNSEDVWPGWGKIPYLRSVPDRPPDGGPDYCSADRNHVLRLTLTPSQLGRLLGYRDRPAGALRLSQVERDSSGRVAALELSVGAGSRPQRGDAGTDGDALGPGDEPLPCELWGGARSAVSDTGPATTTAAERSITLSQLQHSLGDQLRGRLVDTTLFPNGGLALECRGLGHGVGLCQWGAEGMAQPPYNHTFDEILRHYYTGISLGPAPIRTESLALQLRGADGRPVAGASVRLLPAGPSGTTDEQGQWTAQAPAGTYNVEARRGAEATTFYAVRVTAGKSLAARTELVWREREERVAETGSRPAGTR